MLDDILLISLMDTGVPCGPWTPSGWRARSASARASTASSSDAAATRPCCPTAGSSSPTRTAPLAVLFGERAPGHEPRARTRRVTLYAVLVPGVPALYAEEALWASASALMRALEAASARRSRW